MQIIIIFYEVAKGGIAISITLHLINPFNIELETFVNKTNRITFKMKHPIFIKSIFFPRRILLLLSFIFLSFPII